MLRGPLRVACVRPQIKAGAQFSLAITTSKRVAAAAARSAASKWRKKAVEAKEEVRHHTCGCVGGVLCDCSLTCDGIVLACVRWWSLCDNRPRWRR